MSLDIALMEMRLVDVHAQNITHNLSKMATAAGIYDCLWRAPENGLTKANQFIEPLRRGINNLKGNPEYFKTYNPENGWGSYERFLPWLEKLLAACEENPNATIDTSR